MRIKELKDYLGKKITERAQYELTVERKVQGKRVRRKASGDLQRSLTYEVKGRKLRFYAKGDAGKYATFIHYGVNGTKKKWGSPFSYRDKMPPIEPIMKWMKVKGVRLRKVVVRNGVKVNTFVPRYSTITRGKRKGQKVDNAVSAAFAIAKGVQRDGIIPVPFFDKAVGHVMEREREAIEKAIEKEIEFILEL